jgi:hypothetical protein
MTQGANWGRFGFDFLIDDFKLISLVFTAQLHVKLANAFRISCAN